MRVFMCVCLSGSDFLAILHLRIEWKFRLCAVELASEYLFKVSQTWNPFMPIKLHERVDAAKEIPMNGTSCKTKALGFPLPLRKLLSL